MPHDFFLWASSDLEEDKVGIFQQGYRNTVHDALNIMFLWYWTGRWSTIFQSLRSRDLRSCKFFVWLCQTCHAWVY